MDSDEISTIKDLEEAAWAARQRERVIAYLAAEKVEHRGVSLEPRWFLSPYLAIWAVRSVLNPEGIGWWAISGDAPTDYITTGKERDNADVLLSFSRQWKAVAKELVQGRQMVGYSIGAPGREKEFGALLLSRAEFLESVGNDMKSGDAEGEASG